MDESQNKVFVIFKDLYKYFRYTLFHFSEDIGYNILELVKMSCTIVNVNDTYSCKVYSMFLKMALLFKLKIVQFVHKYTKFDSSEQTIITSIAS